MAQVADTRLDLEREVITALRRHQARQRAADQAEAGRDEAIRRAHAGGVPPSRLAEITGLSQARIHQIRHGTRL